MSEPVVLLVDDEVFITQGLERALFAEPFRIMSASSARDALGILASEHVDVIVSDEQMPEMSGSELLMEVRRRYPEVLRIILTGHASVDATVRAINDAAVFRFLRKPCPPPDVAATILAALDSRERAEPNRGSQQELAFTAALATLSLRFQPIYQVSTNTIAAVEVLSRVDHEAFPSIVALLDASERLRRVPDLERAIFRCIAKAIPLMPRDLDIFVNAHPMSLGVASLWDDRSPLAPFFKQLTIEVTERAVLHDGPGIDGVLEGIRARGARIALDDLGAGSSGLAALGALGPDVVKLDMSLIRGVDTSDARREIVGSLLRLAQRLKMRVIAEGVETPAERDCLVGLGCDLVQGFLFARPATLDEFLVLAHSGPPGLLQ